MGEFFVYLKIYKIILRNAMNHIFIAGHLGADPEVRFTSSGQKVTSLRVACHSKKGGKEETLWWKVTIWGEQFDKMIPFFKKGSPIMVAGEFHKPEIFNDKEVKPQISMTMTASQLMFSPFGKQESKQEDRTFSPKIDNGFSLGASYGFNDQKTTKGFAEFDDEQIPF